MNTHEFTLTVIGGGNGGHVLAGLASAKVETRLLTRRPKEWQQTIEVFHEDREVPFSKGSLAAISSEPQAVIPGSDLIIICGPVHIYDTILRRIAPYVAAGTHIGLLFGQGCTHLLSKSLLPVAHFFALQTIPWVCRTIKYGHQTHIRGIKKKVRMAATDSEKAFELIDMLEFLLGRTTVELLSNFTNIVLTPSNQIIHPGRYYGIFHNWDGRTPYAVEDIPLLYGDMDQFSSECLQYLDDELQAIKHGILDRFPDIDLTSVKPLGQRITDDYGDLVRDKSTLRTIFASNYAYRSIMTPVRQVDRGCVPDPTIRLCTDDIPYGLCILKSYAELLEIDTPWIDIIVEWHQQLMEKEYIVNGRLTGRNASECGTPQTYGVATLEEAIVY